MEQTVDLTGVVLETERMRLRPWRQSDLFALYEYASVPGVGEMAGWPHHRSVADSQRILDVFQTEKNVFAVTLKEDDRAIGSLGLHESWAEQDERFRAYRPKEIGYVLSKKFWGQGLTPEAVREVMRFCFEDLEMEMMTVTCFQSNPQSRRVIEKCGFSFAGQKETHLKHLERDEILLCWMLFRADWQKMTR